MCSYIVSKAATSPAEAVISSSQENRPYAPQININQLIKDNTSWAYAAINRNANNMSTPILRLYTVKPRSGVKARFPTRKISRNSRNHLESKATIQVRVGVGEIEEVVEHPFLDMFRKANPQMESFTLRHLFASSLETTGNAYVWKNKNALGTPEELWFLHPQFMKVIADKSSFIRGFEYGTSSNNKWFIPVEDMIYFRYADISSPILGVGPLQKAITAIDLSNSMNEHEINLIRRGGAPETVLTIPADQTVGDKEIKRMKLDFRRHFRGLGNAGKMMIATGGAKLEKFGFSPKEMAYLGGRAWSRSEIYTVFGVPMIFAEVQNVSRANAEDANTEYQRQTIVPKLIMIEDTLNEQLVNDFDERLFVAFDNPVPEDKVFRLKERESNINIGYSSVNEERARDGLDPIDGGDELRNQPVEPVLEPVKRMKRIPPLGMPAANFIPEEFTEAVQEYLKRFGNAVLAQASDAAFKRAKVANPDDLVSKWFDFSIWDKEAENTMLPFIRASILINGPKALDKVGSNRTFDPSSPGVISLLNERKVVIRGMNRTIQKDTRATIAAGITAGDSGGQMRNRIEGVFGFNDKNRAVRIARTETIWALNAGAVEGYKQSGVVEAKEWSTAQDERVCQWCDPMDGKIVGLDTDYFKMGDTFVGRDGGSLGFDIDNIGWPPLHPQCRCSVIPVVRAI